jgi:micrococcal nuclease
VSRHWKPGPPSEWTVIDGDASGARTRGGVVPVVVSAVVIGLAAGGILSWTARHADSEPSAAIEWNAVQAVPTRAPDADDLAWEKRSQEPTAEPVIASPEGARQSSLGRVAKARDDGIYVIDGDTFSMGGQRIRVAGIDAPETHPPLCMEEARLGLAATQKLRELLGSGTVTVSGAGHDQYGRELRSVQAGGQDVGVAMISAGLARRYDGKKRQGWC